jgi:hypothetical protein
MNALEKVQADGPASKSDSDYEKWYDRILEAAHALHPNLVTGASIKGELDDEQGDTIGNYDPYTRTWSKEKHEKLFDVTEER